MDLSGIKERDELRRVLDDAGIDLPSPEIVVTSRTIEGG